MLCVTENSVSLDAETVAAICTYRKLSIFVSKRLGAKDFLRKQHINSPNSR